MSEEKVRLDLAFRGAGWLVGTLDLGTATYALLASHVMDTPGDLVDATRAACVGREGDMLWLHEPNVEVWRLQADGDALRLTVDAVPSWPRVGWSPGPAAAIHRLTRVGWLRAVIRAVSVLGQDQERYRAEWRRDFPAASVRAVQDILPKERARG